MYGTLLVNKKLKNNRNLNEQIESRTVYIISSENKNMAEYFMKANTYAKPVFRKSTGAIEGVSNFKKGDRGLISCVCS